MSQYAWKAVFKFVPTDGIEEVMDLSEVFTDTGRPSSIDVSHVPDVTARIDVNRRGNAKGWGFRPTAKLKFEIFSTERHAYLALIVNRLLATDIWTVYLSLDGGLTYRQVELTPKGYEGPDAIQGKTFVGAKYSLEVQGVDVLDQVPTLGTGVW